MKVLFPSKILAHYVEAYYVSFNLDGPSTPFPAISTSYLKFSQAAAILSGQATRPTITKASSGNLRGLGVKLRPGAASALFGIPAHEVTDRVIPLEDILGNTAHELGEQISAAATPADQQKLFEKTFVRFAQQHQDTGNRIEQQAAILRELSTTQVSRLARQLGYSPRHFQRKFNELVGFSPRLYKRISRFEKAVQLIQMSAKSGKMDWSAVAVRCGYTDQAHLIRDFRQFAGQTPTSYLALLQEN